MTANNTATQAAHDVHDVHDVHTENTAAVDATVQHGAQLANALTILGMSPHDAAYLVSACHTNEVMPHKDDTVPSVPACVQATRTLLLAHAAGRKQRDNPPTPA